MVSHRCIAESSLLVRRGTSTNSSRVELTISDRVRSRNKWHLSTFTDHGYCGPALTMVAPGYGGPSNSHFRLVTSHRCIVIVTLIYERLGDCC